MTMMTGHRSPPSYADLAKQNPLQGGFLAGLAFHDIILKLKTNILFMTYDLAILGGGPAGVSAGVYAARKNLKTVFLTFDFGGQSIVSPDIQNWIGTKSISGNDLAKALEDHLRSYEGENLN